MMNHKNNQRAMASMVDGDANPQGLAINNIQQSPRLSEMGLKSLFMSMDCLEIEKD